MAHPEDLAWLRRAVALARKGCFQVEPNPPVGCVLVGPGGVVGEGWHRAYGGPHAEVEALARAGAAARGATAYVSLAPCSRTGKTPPCTRALLAAGVARVVYAEADPAEPADGSGLAGLVAAGVAVEGPVPAADGAALLARFVAARTRARPWVALKWAIDLTGHAAPRRGAGGAVSGPVARRWLHDLRAHVDAVAVGSETVLVDDPRLTSRLAGGVPDGRSQPLRVVFDRRLRCPPAARLFEDLSASGVVIVTRPEADPARAAALAARGARLLPVAASSEGEWLAAGLGALHALGVRRLLVEGGPRLHGAFVRAGLGDQASVLVAPRLFGGPDPVPGVHDVGIPDATAALHLEETAWRRLGDDLLLQGYFPAPAAGGPA